MKLEKLFENEKIEYFGVIPFEECTVINPSLLDREIRFRPKSVIVFLAPYYTGEYENRNISRYAVSKDYHLFFRDLNGRLCKELAAEYGGSFAGFADSSPIAERPAALKAGLGVSGEMGQLINLKYGSYVFVGEILTDLDLGGTVHPVGECLHCGLCREKCPDGRCFSCLNQQKGEPDEKTKRLICELNCAWGCDVCSECCPMNADVQTTPIEFFYEDRIPFLTHAAVDAMTDAEFAERAYAWKGRKTVARNLEILEAFSNNIITQNPAFVKLSGKTEKQ